MAAGCCGCDGGCCAPGRPVNIDFLYLDLQTCDRCCGTDDVLTAAIEDVGRVLDAAGVSVTVNRVLVDTREKAERYRLMSSPTIRIVGHDIDTDMKETPCTACGDICGGDVDCRTWTYRGEEYAVPPKALIVDAILKAVYGSPASESVSDAPYTMPDNLARFFDAVEKRG